MADQQYYEGTNWWNSSSSTNHNCFNGSDSSTSSNAATTTLSDGGGDGHGWLTAESSTPMASTSSSFHGTLGLSSENMDSTHQQTLMKQEKDGKNFDSMLQNQVMGVNTCQGLTTSPSFQIDLSASPMNYQQNNYFEIMVANSNNQHQHHQQFGNKVPYWNTLQSHQLALPTFEDKPTNILDARDMSSMMNKITNTESNNKRTKNSEGDSSTLPQFKVRKEKMGDKITTLQQLVSPFGKTDTASVLSEAIEYIKFLHEQVGVLSTPYLTSETLYKQNQPIKEKETIDPDEPRRNLRGRGLCLVPISGTFTMTHEPIVDFWTPAFGGSFR